MERYVVLDNDLGEVEFFSSEEKAKAYALKYVAEEQAKADKIGCTPNWKAYITKILETFELEDN